MKFFDTDWKCVFRWLAVWEQLSPEARRHYLLAVPSHAQAVSAAGYGSELPAMIKAGLVETTSSGRIKPSVASVPFRALMAQLAKYPLFDQKPARRLLDDYTHKHYLRDESDRIRSSWEQPAWDSLAWPETFLAQPDPRIWEKPFLTWFEIYGKQHSAWGWRPVTNEPPKVTWFPDPQTIEAAQGLVRAAIESLAPLPLNSLPALLPERLRPFLEPALKACLRFMLLYPALRGDTLDAIISLCPTTVFLRNRPPAVPPGAEPCPNLAGPAFLLEDMTRVLAEAATGECRLNRGGYGQKFYKIIENKFREEFVALPVWLADHAPFPQRLNHATACLLQFKFAKDQGGVGGSRLLQATTQGRRWLAQTPGDRLRELMFLLKRPNPERTLYYDDMGELVPGSLRFGVNDADDFDHLPWLDSIWRQASTDECVAVGRFLDYHARVSHPLVNSVVPDAFRPHRVFQFGSSHHVLREENVEEFTRQLLELFFWKRLVPLGCVETGVRDSGSVCFRLSGAGRYLFGLSADLAYGQPVGESAIMVQPNFEIVFLHPNLNAEIDLVPFAERCGKNVGTLFRLTRRQSIRAAAQGHSVEAVLTALAKHSAKPVPANVTEELRAWFGACRKLGMHRVVIIEAPDHETALRVRRLLGEGAVVRDDTAVEWRGAQIDPDLLKRLSEQGLFLGSP